VFCTRAGKLRGERALEARSRAVRKAKTPARIIAFERGSLFAKSCFALGLDSARLYLGLKGSVADAKRVGNPKHPRWSHAADAPSYSVDDSMMICLMPVDVKRLFYRCLQYRSSPHLAALFASLTDPVPPASVVDPVFQRPVRGMRGLNGGCPGIVAALPSAAEGFAAKILPGEEMGP
jgi:hypothetical protein